LGADHSESRIESKKIPSKKTGGEVFEEDERRSLGKALKGIFLSGLMERTLKAVLLHRNEQREEEKGLRKRVDSQKTS